MAPDDCTSVRGLDLLESCFCDQTSVVRRKQFLSLEEIDKVKAASVQLGKDVKKWDTIYLQVGGHFQREEPELYAKICDLVAESDEENWGLLSGCDKELGAGVNPRTIEFHEYGLDARRVCGTHGDTGSLITVDIMLSHTSAFEGGEFQTVAASSSDAGGKARDVTTTHEFEQGDAMVFVSHKRHLVCTVTSGTRCVLVLEFWEGSACTGSHRCMNQSCGSPYLYDDSEDSDSNEGSTCLENYDP